MTIVLNLPDSTCVLGLTKDASPDGKFVVITPQEKKEATNEA